MKLAGRIVKAGAWGFLSLVLIYLLFLRSWLMHWGSTQSERDRHYPGDSIVVDPKTSITIAITVNKPPSEIWPWIAQMGLNKGGFYSYTWLENIFGCKLHNANVIHSEWQHVKEGDIEPVCATAAKQNLSGWVVARLIPQRAFVYRISSDSSWTMGYYIDSLGSSKSRLITRMKYNAPEKFRDKIIDKAWMEWAHCIMQRGSIKGIKKRAERSYSEL